MPYNMAYYNGSTTTTYYFTTNLQGDVTELRLADNTCIAKYEYDAWGKLLTVKDGSSNTITDASHVGLINPIRYRGYYYDSETGLYYLMSRYYDPEIGRFINSDLVGVISATPSALTDKNLFAYCDNNPVIRVDVGGAFWHVIAGAVAGAAIGAVSSVVSQAVTGKDINWAEVAVSAASGAVTGAVMAACPTLGAVATGVVHGVVGAGTHVATELVNGRKPTVAGTVVAGVTSGVLAGGAKAISTIPAKPKIPQNTGVPFKGVGLGQVGVDPNTLKLNPNFSPNPAKYDAALNQIRRNGMYGIIDVSRDGLVYNGQHRVLIARQLGIAVDVSIR